MLFDFLSSKPECLDLRSYLLKKKYLSLPYDVYVFATDSCSNSILQIGDFLGFVITFFTGYSPFHFSGDFSEYLKCDLKNCLCKQLFDTGSQTFLPEYKLARVERNVEIYMLLLLFFFNCMLASYVLSPSHWSEESQLRVKTIHIVSR